MAGREVLKELDPKSITFKRFAQNLPIQGTMKIPVAMVCKTCDEFIFKGKLSKVRREYLSDEEYRLGIKFSMKCPKCSQKVFFIIDPLNTDCKIKTTLTGEMISLNLEENDSI